jgi:excisionase family DNA binding protein
MQTTDDLLTSSQVSRMLRVSLSTVTRLGNNGKLTVAHTLPGVRGTRLYSRASVDAYLAAQDAKWGATA